MFGGICAYKERDRVAAIWHGTPIKWAKFTAARELYDYFVVIGCASSDTE